MYFVDPRDRHTAFAGTVTEAAAQFPEEVNVSVAAALAGHGPDRTTIDVIRPGPGEPRELQISARSRYGSFETIAIPGVDPAAGIHVCAANIIAALTNEVTPLRVR